MLLKIWAKITYIGMVCDICDICDIYIKIQILLCVPQQACRVSISGDELSEIICMSESIQVILMSSF